MIYTDLTKKALKLCFHAHKDQLDKSGLPYVFHPFHLAEQMQTEEEILVALLHDVVEDSPVTFEDLALLGMPGRVLEALKLMTHNKAVPYMEYVAAIKADPLARKVKLADLKHNSDTARMDHPSQQDLQRVLKYRSAIALLEE